VIDAHQHFWTTARDDYGWLSPDDAVLYRDFGPSDLAPLIAEAGITQTVLVQAAPTLAETEYLLGLADDTDWVGAVVGWAPLDAPDVEATLEGIAAHPKLRGVRPMIQDIPDDDWMLGDEVGVGLRALAGLGLRFDALVHPRHLGRLRTLLGRHPDLRVVIDHGAKPEIRAGRFDGWAADMRAIARETDACCKLSGLLTEARPGAGAEELRRYAAHLFECFGPERLMWGSDWPVVELAGGFSHWGSVSEALLAGLPEVDRAAIRGETARRFYGLGPR
jgi:L-fuconolactonase